MSSSNAIQRFDIFVFRVHTTVTSVHYSQTTGCVITRKKKNNHRSHLLPSLYLYYSSSCCCNIEGLFAIIQFHMLHWQPVWFCTWVRVIGSCNLGFLWEGGGVKWQVVSILSDSNHTPFEILHAYGTKGLIISLMVYSRVHLTTQ